MIFLPVVERELRQAARRPATFRSRLLAAIVATFIVSAVLLVSWAGASPPGLGAGVFQVLTVLSFGFCLLSGVFLTADALSREIREGTLGLLFLTDLRSIDVVLGKLVARSVTATYGLLAVFPVLSLTLVMGGVTAGDYWRMVLVLLNTVFLSLTVGLLVSSLTRDEHRAMLGTLLFMLLVTAVPPLIQSLIPAGAGLGTVIASISPLTAWSLAPDVAYRTDRFDFWGASIVIHLLAWICLGATTLRLPWAWRERGARPEQRFRQRRLRRASLTASSEQAHALSHRNPVAWLGGRRMAERRWWLWMLLLVVAGLGICVDLARGNQGRHLSSVTLWGMTLCLRALVGLEAGRFFVESRRTGAFELLLCTPLPTQDIIQGNWLALRQHYRAPVFVVLAAHLVPVAAAFSSVAGRGDLLGFLFLAGYTAFGALTFVADVVALAWLGMFLGATSRRPAWVPVLTLVYGILIPATLFCVPRILIDVPLFWALRDQLQWRLRRLGARSDLGTVPAPG